MKKFLTVLTAVPLAIGLGAFGTGAANADSGSLATDQIRTYDGPLDDALGSIDDLVPDEIARQVNAFLAQWGVHLPFDLDDDWDDDWDDRDDDWDDDDWDDDWDD